VRLEDPGLHLFWDARLAPPQESADLFRCPSPLVTCHCLVRAFAHQGLWSILARLLSTRLCSFWCANALAFELGEQAFPPFRWPPSDLGLNPGCRRPQ